MKFKVGQKIQYKFKRLNGTIDVINAVISFIPIRKKDQSTLMVKTDNDWHIIFVKDILNT